MTNNKFKQNKIFFLISFFFFTLTASFGSPQLDITWSTIRGDNVPRVIQMNSVKAEIMSLAGRYGYVSYTTEPGTRANEIQSSVEAKNSAQILWQ